MELFFHVACSAGKVEMSTFSLADVIEKLKGESFEQTTGSVLELSGKLFINDHHCPDVLVFSPDAAQELHDHHLVSSGHIVMQVTYTFIR